MLDLPASTITISPVAGANTKAGCPVSPGITANCMAETDYSYDEAAYLTSYETTVGALPTGSHVTAPNPAPVRGNLSTVSKWLSTGGAVASHINWYDTGEPHIQSDPLGHTTTISYDLAYNGALPTKTCNAKNQCVSATYDLNTGLLASFTDQNASSQDSGTSPGDPAHTWTYCYDQVARLKGASFPADPLCSQPLTSFDYSDPTTVKRSQLITSAVTDTLTTHLDGLGHVSQTEHLTPDGTVIVHTDYDGLGQATSVTNPYLTTADATYGTVQSARDGLGRPTTITEQDQSVKQVDYSAGNCVTSTDEAGNPRRTCSDALGRLVEVDEPAGGAQATSSTGSLSITGSELSTQVLTTPAVAGTGSVQIGGTPQWKAVSSSSTGGTTKISVSGGEQQYPAGVIAGSGTITFSGTEQAIPATAGVGGASVSGTLQSVQTQAATQATGSVTIYGTEQSKTVQGTRYCAAYTINGATCVDWEYNTFDVADSGSVTITVNGHADAVNFTGGSTTTTIASALASQINGDAAAFVTAVASGATVGLTSKSTGAPANVSLASSYTYDSADFTAPSFTTGNSAATLTGGLDQVIVYDSGACTITVGGHSDTYSWSGSGTNAAGIAGALNTAISNDTLSPVSDTLSGATVDLSAKSTGAASNYALSGSCSHDTMHFATGSFTISLSGATLTGGKDQINDHGTFSVTVNGHTSPGTSWGAGYTSASIASDVAGKINADTAAAVSASYSGSMVTLTAKVMGSISNYTFSVSPSGYDAADFATSSFSAAPSGANLTGGWPNPSAVDSGTMTVTVNAKPYTVNWGATDTPGTIASNLVTALGADTTITPTLSGTTVYINPKQAGTAYSFSTAYTYDTADFTHSSFSTANSISDWGTFSITAGGHTDSVPWAGLSTPSTIATALANQINADGLALVNATASADPPPATTSTLSLQARSPGAGSNYSLASSITFDSTHFTAASMSGSNSGAALVNGADAKYKTVYDSGTATLSIGGSSYTVDYGQTDTYTSIATNLAARVNAGGMVNATVSGDGCATQIAAGEPCAPLSLTAIAAGTETNYSLSYSSTSSQSSLFPSPSFAASIPNASMNGGADQVPGTLASPLVTLYSYDVLGDLLCVEQHGDAATGTGCSAPPGSDVTSPWRVRRFTYDSLGRLLSASNPESNTAIDASANVVRVPTTYSYDADGNLLQKTSPAANQPGTATQTISYCYDELNRVTGKAYSAQSCPLTSPAVTYTYDSGANAIGHLTVVTDQAGSASYSYDTLGRLASETRVINGISKSLSYDYNLDGSLSALHYPSGAVVTYAPDSAGRTTSATDTANGINYVTGAAYGPDGQMTGFVSGGNITSAFSYNKRLQPVTMSAQTALQTVFSIGYDFHVGNGTTGSDNGNVWSIYNYRDRTRDQSFTYDTLNRLLSAQNAGSDCNAGTVNGQTEYWGNSYAYDAWGNLTKKSITKCGAENLTLTALVNNQLSGYGYDAAGNMTSDPTDSVSSTYDAENRIATASTPSGVFTYTYDADGNRVEKSGAGTGTIYWYMTPGIIGESDLSGVMKSEYVFFNGERVARRDLVTPGGVLYYFSDHLKTASVVTDSAGNIKSESDYYPWGGELQFVNNDSNHYKFTGKERDSESGLDYFGARYYSNGLGRFITPDWAAKAVDVPYAEFSDPQSLNLYSYVRNVPTTKTDPDGHCTKDGEKHGALWCIGHALGFTETKKEQQQQAKAYQAAKQRWEGAHPGMSFEQHQNNVMMHAVFDFSPFAELSVGSEAIEGAAAAGRLVEIVEQEGNTVHLVIKGAKGNIEVITEMTKEGDKLILRGTHIQGQGAGTSSVSELRAAARQLGKQQGVKEVIVEGGTRTSGASVGKTPIPIRIKVD